MQHRIHQFKNLPTTQSGWNAIVEPLKDIYWNARREGETENNALLFALDALWTNLDNAR
jgi:hypothetical protein